MGMTQQNMAMLGKSPSKSSQDNYQVTPSQLPSKVFQNAVASGADLTGTEGAGVVNISFAGEHLDSTKKDTDDYRPNILI